MKDQGPQNKPKFSIDGDIKTPGESAYLRHSGDQQKTARLRTTTTILVVLLLGSASLNLWLLLKNQSLNSESGSPNSKQVLSILSNRIDSLRQVNDSLTLNANRLELANDLLVENSDQLKGIFFEVHLPFSGDFDLKEYQSELAQLRSEEYDNRSGLVLARFRSYKKALLFENDLKKMGISDLQLLGRVDGRIMTFKEAMALVQNQNN